MPRKKKMDVETQNDISTETNVPEIELSKLAKFDVMLSKVVDKNRNCYGLGTFFSSNSGGIGYLAYLIYRDRTNINPFVNYVIEHYPMYVYISDNRYNSRDIPTLDDEKWINRVIHVCNILCRSGRAECIRSMFWALLLLALDDTDDGERLSIACDFARMLDISDEEMLDLVNVVKYVLQDDTYEKPKLEHINKTFVDVLNMYER